MNETPKNKMGSSLKFLAIVGFIVAIIIISWFSIKLVDVAPNTFSSLASIAESLDYRVKSDNTAKENDVSPLTVTSDLTWINSGETININWNSINPQGSYTFSYSCTDGVSIDIKDDGGTLKGVACDTNYNLGNTNVLSIAAESDENRFKNVKYKVAYIEKDKTDPSTENTASFTIINKMISDIKEEVEVAEEPVVVAVVEEPTETGPVAEESEVVSETPVTNQTPTYQQEFVYTIPSSDPNGRTDLSAQFLNTGKIIGDTFFSGAMFKNESGAIQFEVKNLGSKTSDDWTYTVGLPNGGTYDSTDQAPLKPNEQAVITIGFPAGNSSSHTFVVSIDESTDKNSLNDHFSRTVNFTD